MAWMYRIDPARAFVHSVAAGRITGPELLAHAKTLAADPAFRPSFTQLADFSRVTDMDITPEDVRRLAEINPFAPEARRVVLIPFDFGFGLGRMYQALVESSGHEVVVVRDEDEAWARAGVPRG